MTNIDQTQFQELLAKDSNALILDVRTPAEWSGGIIPNAACIDVMNTNGFIAQIDNLDKSKNIYVYCRSGQRSQVACNLLEQSGFKTTYNLLGGITAWRGEVVQA